MAEYIIQEETLVGIADAIRIKTGESGQIAVADMADKISGIAVGETVEKVETTVALDFSEGDMQLTPEDGKAFSSINIPAPATLIPENIAEGVDIAGIVGTLAAGGGGGAKFAYGTISNDATSTVTIEHGLGVVPDVVLVAAPYAARSKASSIGVAFGVSQSLRELIPIDNSNAVKGSTGFFNISSQSQPITHTGNTTPIKNATETTFGIFASSGSKLYSGTFWLAIGGLT